MSKYLTQRTLINRGTVTFTRGQIRAGQAAAIDNRGTFTAYDGARMTQWLGGVPLLIR